MRPCTQRDRCISTDVFLGHVHVMCVRRTCGVRAVCICMHTHMHMHMHMYMCTHMHMHMHMHKSRAFT